MTIPRAEEIASMVAMPVLAAAAVGAGVPSAASPGDGGASIGSWLKAGISKVGLAPLTVNRMPLRPKKPSPLDDAEDSKPYVLAKPLVETSRPSAGAGQHRPEALEAGTRRHSEALPQDQRGRVSALRPIPDDLLLGAAVRNRPMALFGATVVVLLNVGRLIAGVANLSVVPFRDGINLSKMKKPFRRVLEPLLTIGLVILAFTFIPWLSTGKAAKGSLGGVSVPAPRPLKRISRARWRGWPTRPRGSTSRSCAQAQEKLKGLGSPSAGGAAKPPATEGGPTQTPSNAIRGLIKDVGERARATIDEAQKQP